VSSHAAKRTCDYRTHRGRTRGFGDPARDWNITARQNGTGACPAGCDCPRCQVVDEMALNVAKGLTVDGGTPEGAIGECECGATIPKGRKLCDKCRALHGIESARKRAVRQAAWEKQHRPRYLRVGRVWLKCKNPLKECRA
jgi:hypothetical protein